MEEESKRSFILRAIKRDPSACDFLFGLLVGAARSYRHDTVLRPHPNIYGSDTDTDDAEHDKHHKLIELVDSIPSIKHIPGVLSSMGSEAIDLLWWTFNTKNFTLSSCHRNAFEDVQEKTGQIYPTPSPNYIFEVKYTDMAEARFQEKTNGTSTVFAYHGSRLDNFHSILQFGLHCHMNKNGLFGEGTYLSSELSVSMPYAPTGSFWKKSGMGDKASCLAVCEIISDNPGVKCQIKDPSTGEARPSRARVRGSLGGDIPEKYYLIQNNEAMRVKYVLMYADSTPHAKRFQESWIYKHKFLMLIMFYVLMLVCIGLYNSRSFRYFLRRIT